ncbi:unnamed protein product [Ilex paraguariensis]|uniref:Disease resistance RPP13-like protein 1 n=1 Tax=Ilex paraguariensis TaxID=185542 RepID=A0ABC8SXT8_9AQUA
MAVAEIFLTAFVIVLFERLVSYELLNFALREGIHTQVRKCSQLLIKIQAVLSDAETKQIIDKAVKLWPEDLRDVAYDLDDLLDEIATEALADRLKSEPEASTSRETNVISTYYSNFARTFALKMKMGPKIEEITARLQVIAELKDDLDLRVSCVALAVGSVPVSHLKELSDDDFLSLLAQHTMGTRNFDAHPSLEIVGMDIAGKCRGLPLAAKTLGGLLRTKNSLNEWENVLHSKIWDLPEHKSDILPVLKRSYHRLPSQLKQLFAYCAIFPKDYEFDKDELILLWMAEGFLQQSEGMKLMEEIGGYCFDELLSRSFFQRSSGTEQKFVMHDLLNDLAQSVAGEICLTLDNNIESNVHFRISQKTCHSSFIRHYHEVSKRFKQFHELQCLRTFLPLPVHKPDHYECHFSSSILFNLLPKLQCLRVLSLSGYQVSELPDSIGDLKHLRYLDLSRTMIQWLLESVSTLYNLQTLSLRDCLALCKLPSNIGNLVNLGHLDNANTGQLQEMPTGIGKLTNLQTLLKIFVGRSNGLGLRDLNSLLHVRGMLSIVGLENVKDARDAEEANLNHKQNLDELELKWGRDVEHSQNEGLQIDVLDMLQPHRKLIGQLPLLKELHIEGMDATKSVGTEFYGDGNALKIPFPSLEILRLEEMPEWEEWSIDTGAEVVGNHFPCLRELTMRNCPKLASVSLLRLPSLRKLEIENCREVVLESFSELTTLTSLKIQKILGLTHRHKEFLQFLVSLQVLEIGSCATLVSLWENGITPRDLFRLQRLYIWGCPQLVYLVEDDQMLPCNLECLEVYTCDRLERLPNGLKDNKSLKELRIRHCPKLESFPDANLPPMLRSLEIGECSALVSVPNCISHLEELELYDCVSLASMPTDTLPSTLRILRISNCGNLESVTDTIEQNKGHWPNLESLSVSTLNFECYLAYQIGQSFPRSGFLTPNLRRLSIRKCANLFSVANQIESLTSLEELRISDCQSLESFPNGNLPPNLKTVYISNCENLKPLSEWGLHRLYSLQRFEMNGVYPELLSFPGKCVFPAALTFLRIGKITNLNSLSMGLQNLTSLKHLEIYNCPNLRSLPNERTLATLSSLTIRDCPLIKQWR